MFIKLLVRLLFGYVRIEVEGYYIERFINICTNNKILIWNLKRKKGVKLYLSIGVNDFKKLSAIARKTNCKIKILRKKGIPFLLNRYKKRKIFAIFLILVMLIIFISSKYVWNVNISVKDDLQLENIEEDIKLLGISKGVKKDEIDTDKVINELRLKRDDIAWVGIDIEGTTVKINIVKADKAPNIVNNSDYCNIVASKSGVIQKIIAQNGTAVVKVGDTVQKGDILIAGYMEGKYTDTRYVHSMGEVEALVSYQKSKEVKFKVSDEKTYSLDEAVKIGSEEIMAEVQERRQLSSRFKFALQADELADFRRYNSSRSRRHGSEDFKSQRDTVLFRRTPDRRYRKAYEIRPCENKRERTYRKGACYRPCEYRRSYRDY